MLFGDTFFKCIYVYVGSSCKMYFFCGLQRGKFEKFCFICQVNSQIISNRTYDGALQINVTWFFLLFTLSPLYLSRESKTLNQAITPLKVQPARNLLAMGIPSIVSMKLLVQVEPLVTLPVYTTHTYRHELYFGMCLYVIFQPYKAFVFMIFCPKNVVIICCYMWIINDFLSLGHCLVSFCSSRISRSSFCQLVGG